VKFMISAPRWINVVVLWREAWSSSVWFSWNDIDSVYVSFGLCLLTWRSLGDLTKMMYFVYYLSECWCIINEIVIYSLCFAFLSSSFLYLIHLSAIKFYLSASVLHVSNCN
jgi:hypothetical protein